MNLNFGWTQASPFYLAVFGLPRLLSATSPPWILRAGRRIDGKEVVHEAS